MKKDFFWIHKDYGNESLNNIAKRLVEYHTAYLIRDFNVHYVYEEAGYLHSAPVGKIFLDKPYTVSDSEIINSLMNYNVYFKSNTEDPIDLKNPIEGLNFIVSLAAGGDFKDDYLRSLQRYIIDISPRAIEKSQSFLDVPTTNFYQLDIFNQTQVNEFLKIIDGDVGLIHVSNCFLYIPNCILFDIYYRLGKQNQFLDCLRADSREWYVNMCSANGEEFYNMNVNDFPNSTIDDRFKVLPWIK
jgi:hypothetical protein